MAEQSLQIKRNKKIFESKEEAVNHLQTLTNKLDDGEIVLCRYFNDETIQTLIGFETKYEITNENDELQTIETIAYLDSFSEVGDGFFRDDKGILQINAGDGLIIKDNKIQVALENGLEIKDGKINAKVNKKITNFLHVDADGLKVDDINANVTKTTEQILIMGGPLATTEVKTELGRIFGKDANDNPYIPANTDLQSLLVNLFCKELYPSISASNSQKGSVIASINAPTITLSSTASTLEVGTKISASTISFNGNSKARVTKSMVTGMTYGYSFTNDSQEDSNETSLSKDATTGLVQTATTKMVCSLSGFTKSKFTDITGTTTLSKTSYDLGQIISGTNTITISITGQPISYSIDSIPVLYPTSNIGKTQSGCVTTKIDAVSGTTTAPTSSASKSINGVRYGFYGIIIDDPDEAGQETFEYNSTNIRKLTPLKSKQTFYISGDNVGRVIIALPSSWNAQIDTIIDAEQMNQDLYGSETGYSSQYKEVSVEGANNYTAEVYHVYTFDPQTPIKINQTITFK